MKGTVAGVKCNGSRNMGNKDGNQYDNYSNNTSLPQLGQDRYPFHQKHPGKRCCHLYKLVLHVTPKLSLPRGELCNIKLLKIDVIDPDADTVILREQYTKTVLLMFYTFRRINDLMIEGSFWMLFDQQRMMHSGKKKTRFWPKDFEILQNIQNRVALEKGLRCAHNELTRVTNCRDPDNADKRKYGNDDDHNDKSPDITSFCHFDE